MEREPTRQQHDLHWNERYAAPWHLFEQRQGDAREDVATRGTTMRKDRVARPDHVHLVGVRTHELQRIIRFYGTREIEVAAVVQRPAAVLGLPVTKVVSDFPFQHVVHFAHEVVHQYVFRGNGTVG